MAVIFMVFLLFLFKWDKGDRVYGPYLKFVRYFGASYVADGRRTDGNGRGICRNYAPRATY